MRFTRHLWAYGEIGKRNRPRTCREIPWEFDSPYAHRRREAHRFEFLIIICVILIDGSTERRARPRGAMVDAVDSKSIAERYDGSIPFGATTLRRCVGLYFLHNDDFNAIGWEVHGVFY